MADACVVVDFIEQLADLCRDLGSGFTEVLPDVDEPELAARLSERHARPSRFEHCVLNDQVGPEDAGELLASLARIRCDRPGMHSIDAAGSLSEVVDRVDSVWSANRSR